MSVVSFALGASTWSVLEYVLHRFSGHAPRASKDKRKPGLFDGDFGSEHQAHHTDTRYFTPTPRKVAAAAVVLPTIAIAGSFLVGPRHAIGFALGFGAAYASYETLHRRIHTHAPWNPYSRWARRHHLAHHFKSPRHNHGVTSPLWDVVFGTYQTPEQVRVPRRHAPDWLLDESGQIALAHRRDYTLGGGRVDPSSGSAQAPEQRLDQGLPA